MSRVRIAVVSPVRLHREGFRRALQDHKQVELVGCFPDQAACAASASDHFPDAVLVDAHAIASQTSLQELRATPEVRIPALCTTETADETVACIRAGIDGIVGRDATVQQILNSLNRIAGGEMPLPASAGALIRQLMSSHDNTEKGLSRLTKKELLIAKLAATGLIDKKIAGKLGIELSTVKNHLHNIYQKLGVHRRSELAALFWASGLSHQTEDPT